MLEGRNANTDLWDDSMERASLVPQLLSILLRTYCQLTEIASCERDSFVIELENDAFRRFRTYRDVEL